MGVARRVVFPILRIIIWAVIAGALVALVIQQAKPAEPTTGPEVPHSEFTDPQVPVTVQTISNSVSVDASVVADAASTEKATGAGEVRKLYVADGERVEAGAPLVLIIEEKPRDPLVTTDAEGNTVTKERKPEIIETVVKASTAGTVKNKVLVKQTIAVGDEVAAVSPGSFSIVAPLKPEQQYRLVSAPTSAEVTITGGPAPFLCTNFRTENASTDQSQGDGTAVQARCGVPAEVTVFPGLAAKLAIITGQAENALTLPVTAVQGSFETGVVWVMGADGVTPEKRDVKLGMTDGSVIQIAEGVSEGEMVLQFIPIGTPATPENGGEGTDPSQGGDGVAVEEQPTSENAG